MANEDSIFGQYAQYYDLLYQDKDYPAEARYIRDLIKKYAPDAETIADLGCGTGRHAELLKDLGYKVHGIDRSKRMLDNAVERCQGKAGLSFQRGSLQDFALAVPADVITALFHVMSYQTTDEEFRSALMNIHRNLRSGGIFLFDCWYGSAVLWQKPELRIKRMENETLMITRIAEPILCENRNIVDVNYTIFIQDKNTGIIKELSERHTMRYFFLSEMESLLKENNLELIDSFEFMSGRPLSKDTWGSCFVVQRR